MRSEEEPLEIIKGSNVIRFDMPDYDSNKVRFKTGELTIFEAMSIESETSGGEIVKRNIQAKG